MQKTKTFTAGEWNTACKDLYNALKFLNHAEHGYCICPLNDGRKPDAEHSTACLDARLALRHAESNHADWRNDTEVR